VFAKKGGRYSHFSQNLFNVKFCGVFLCVDNPPSGALPLCYIVGMKTHEILAQRGGSHGNFTDNARFSQQLKFIVEMSPNWENMSDVQREALHMILHKISRICAGNPDHHDHWDDIAGYATLVSERIT